VQKLGILLRISTPNETIRYQPIRDRSLLGRKWRDPKETKGDQDKTQTRQLRPQLDQKETHSRPKKGDLFTTTRSGNVATRRQAGQDLPSSLLS
jgi:hypothetical protein